MIAKFPRIGADVFVLDLEDALPAADRPAARNALREGVRIAKEGAPRQVFLRVNDARSSDFAADMEAAAHSGVDGIVLPKAESVEDVRAARAAMMTELQKPLIVGIESIRGVLNVDMLAAVDGVRGLYFGAEDFAAEMGARRTLSGLEVLYARSRAVLAAKAARIAAIDQAVVQLRDDAQFKRDASMARDLGFDGKICLLPRQVELANEAFAPSDAEVDRARRLIDAYEAAKESGRGAIDFEGQMVDEPVLKSARSIVAAARDERQ